MNLEFTWNDLKLISEILVAMGLFLWFFYNRLNSKIEKLETKLDNLDTKFDQKFDRMDQKFDQKFDRLFELLAFRNQPPQRVYMQKPKGKSA